MKPCVTDLTWGDTLVVDRSPLKPLFFATSTDMTKHLFLGKGNVIINQRSPRSINLDLVTNSKIIDVEGNLVRLPIHAPSANHPHMGMMIARRDYLSNNFNKQVYPWFSRSRVSVVYAITIIS